MYIAPGQGQTPPWGQMFNVNRKPLSLCLFVAGLQKLLWSLILYVYSPGRGKQSTGDKTLMITERPFLFAHMLQVSKWSLWNLVLYTFLMIFTCIYSRGARAENPLGTNFWCQQKSLITLTICCKFQTNLFEFWFYTHFLIFFHLYIALGQGQTTICGQNTDVNRKALSLCQFVASFKKISFEVWFYT